MVTNKLYLDDKNDDYIVLCKFGSHTISGYRVIGIGRPKLTSERHLTHWNGPVFIAPYTFSTLVRVLDSGKMFLYSDIEKRLL